MDWKSKAWVHLMRALPEQEQRVRWIVRHRPDVAILLVAALKKTPILRSATAVYVLTG